jgi:hypothetical protein
MTTPSYVKPELVSLKDHPEFSEAWLQDRIADDPKILGLGDVVFRDRERLQPRAGRLDLLLQDTETRKRYEVEIQLGTVDESHIIRTIEYWDIERKRYPQYDHCAVIIAEKITSRFLNVISLFNGTIPLIAIQVQAVKIGDSISLIFSTVLGEVQRGLVDEDEDAESAPTDRNYWIDKGDKKTVALADQVAGIARTFDPQLELKYNKFYIGMARNGKAFNFLALRPRKTVLNLDIGLPETEETTARIEAAGFDCLDYDTRYTKYRLRLTGDDLKTRAEPLSELIGEAYRLRAD